MRLFDLSEINNLSALIAIPDGYESCALIACPVSPENPEVPIPATVVIIFVPAEIFLAR